MMYFLHIGLIRNREELQYSSDERPASQIRRGPLIILEKAPLFFQGLYPEQTLALSGPAGRDRITVQLVIHKGFYVNKL